MCNKFTENVKAIAGLTGKPTNTIYGLISGQRTAGRGMAAVLEKACKAINIDCPRAIWVWGSKEEKKRRLSK